MLATCALRRVGTARAFSTTTSTTARAAAARAALAASTRHVGARWTAAAAPRARWRDAMKARAAATTAPVRARLALAAPRLRLRELLAPRLRLLAARRPRRLARLKAAAAAHTAAVKERARRAAALAVAFRARRAGYASQLADAWRTYGWTAVGTHFAVYGTTLAGLTAAVDVGLLGGGRARDEAVAKLSALVDNNGVAYGLRCDPGNRPDVTLLEATLGSALVELDAMPLYADRGYDSRRNRGVCLAHGLADRIFRRRCKTVRRTNARRIVVEHTFAWLGRYRRLLHCFEATSETFTAYALLAAGNLLSRRFFSDSAFAPTG